MKLQLLTSGVFIAVLTLLSACSKKDSLPAPDPCAGVNYTITSTQTEAVGTANNGTLTILAPRGDTISYKLNSGAYQASWYFTSLAPGNYIVTIKNQKGCTDTTQLTILHYGPKYAAVKQVITNYCGPCHVNGGVTANKNFDTDASIVSSWDRIKIRAVDNLPTAMPELPNSPLTNVDKQKITDWVNAGHRQTD